VRRKATTTMLIIVVVSITGLFLRGGVVSPTSNPQPGVPGAGFGLVPHLRPARGLTGIESLRHASPLTIGKAPTHSGKLNRYVDNIPLC